MMFDSRTYDDMTPQFTTLINGGIQALVYNGDADAVCNFIGAEVFLKNLGYPATTLYKVTPPPTTHTHKSHPYTPHIT